MVNNILMTRTIMFKYESAVIYVSWSALDTKKKSSGPKKCELISTSLIGKARWESKVQSLSFYRVLDAVSAHSIS